ncbi:hypothetical protein FHR47_002547 [Xanthomonas arboricola]|uniref:hypothetical protein n=1 Tax=Xanthomonas cannabis TaxID=1885674 RepID=UPI00161CFEC7|nr:hypothetical protein [Xanthomonas cannabis]MBB3802280.1 hypothetical protein [Xanthomonas cannabis]
MKISLADEFEEIDLSSDGEESEDEVEQDVEESSEETDESEAVDYYSPDVQDFIRTVKDASYTVDIEQNALSQIAAMERNPIASDNVVGQNQELDEAVTATAEIRERAAVDESPATAKGKLYTRFKFLSWVLGAPISVGAGLLSAWLFSITRSNNQADPTKLSDDQKSFIRSQLDTWIAKPDSEFWNNMAEYVDTYDPSLEAQIYFMSYTATLCPNQSVWNWSAQEKNRAVQTVVASYAKEKKVSEFYRTVANLKVSTFESPAPALMPRAVAASVCELSLGYLAKSLSI